MEQKLLQVFERYAAFGAGSASGPKRRTLDGSRFVKVFRDAKVLDSKVSSTTVDLIFAKVKDKTERRITFQQFLHGLELVAKAKYPSDPNAFELLAEALVANIEARGGPSVTSATAANTQSGIFAKLTDSSLYTGLHKDKFNELEAPGTRGGATGGRVAAATARNRAERPVSNLSQITRTNLSVGPTSFHT